MEQSISQILSQLSERRERLLDEVKEIDTTISTIQKLEIKQLIDTSEEAVFITPKIEPKKGTNLSLLDMIIEVLTAHGKDLTQRTIYDEMLRIFPDQHIHFASLSGTLSIGIKKGLLKRIKIAGRNNRYTLNTEKKEVTKRKIKVGFNRPNYGIGKEIRNAIIDFFKDGAKFLPEDILILISDTFPNANKFTVQKELDRCISQNNLSGLLRMQDKNGFVYVYKSE